MDTSSWATGVKRPLVWRVGFTADANTAPQEFVPARVPGAVQLDWAQAKGWPDHNVADNWRDYLWMEDVYWLYQAPLEFPALKGGERLVFACGGVDYRFQVRLCGTTIHDQEGMFTPFEVDLTGRAAPGDLLEVLVFPAPKSRPEPANRVQANQSCKPAVSYGWDFHPRLVPLGIWEEAWLDIRAERHLASAELFYELSADLCQVDVRLVAACTGSAGGVLRWRLLDADGACVLEQQTPVVSDRVEAAGVIANPRLWWPNGQGESHLYRLEVELRSPAGASVGRRATRVGFRRVRLVMHPGAWDHPPINQFPKSRSHPPITLEINGREIFCKGSNWVAPDIFPGQLTAVTYRSLLTLAKDAHMNLLRCWGGAIVQKEAFFELCDEMGLMVWQEFPLACNRYESTPAYLRVLDQESRSIIRRLRPHASVVIWCGGNELFNVWSGMTDQDLALRLLNRNCFDLDPQRPFLMTSPLDGMGHGHYVFRSAEGDEVFQLFARAGNTAYTEFGCGGPASVETLRRIIPAADFFPPKPGTAWETHHAVKAWAPNSHLLLDVIEDYFGPAGSLEQLVERGQLLQGEGLKCLFEEARRQKPRAAMALNWCFNEPWPCAANLSILSWPDEPKAAYAAVKAALRPVLASACIPKFRWREGESFSAELWLLSDGTLPVEPGRMEATLEIAGREIFLLGWDHPGTAANTNLAGPTLRCVLPAAAADHMLLRLRVPGRPEWGSTYYLMCVSIARSDEHETRQLNQ